MPPSGDWLCWLIQTGRGWGKTRTGAETTIEMARSGKAKHIHLVARSAADVRDVMVEGESGILSISRDGFRPDYEPSKRRLTWPNGATATTFSADKPDQLRGPQCDWAWCDELASWRYPAAFDMMRFGLRLGTNPRVVVTTTPRPRRFLRDLANHSKTIVTTGSTMENADNLAETFITSIFDRYGGTHLGRQELEGEMLDELPGAIFTRRAIEDNRVQNAPELSRIIVAIDPAVTSNESSCESGIIVAGVGEEQNHFYVLEDASQTSQPDIVLKEAIRLYYKHKGDAIVVEKNQGGDLWKNIANQLDASVPVYMVHASRGKFTRAEPVAARYEQGRVHHVGIHPDLEDQLVSFVPGNHDGGDDRLDALVWAVTQLDSASIPAFNFNSNDNATGDTWAGLRF